MEKQYPRELVQELFTHTPEYKRAKTGVGRNARLSTPSDQAVADRVRELLKRGEIDEAARDRIESLLENFERQ